MSTRCWERAWLFTGNRQRRTGLASASALPSPSYFPLPSAPPSSFGVMLEVCVSPLGLRNKQPQPGSEPGRLVLSVLEAGSPQSALALQVSREGSFLVLCRSPRLLAVVLGLPGLAATPLQPLSASALTWPPVCSVSPSACSSCRDASHWLRACPGPLGFILDMMTPARTLFPNKVTL